MSKAKYYHYYNMDNLKDDLVTESIDKYCLLCPYCMIHNEPNRKPTLFIYKESMTGYCFRCNSFIYTSKDIHRYIANSIDREFNTSLKSITNTDYLMNLDVLNLKGLDSYETDNELVNYIKTERVENYHNLLISLNCKSFTKKITDTYKVKGIFFPFYIGNKVVSFQIRFINVDKKFRYFTKQGIKIPFLYNQDTSITELTICEGIFDVLAYKVMNFPNPIAILGSAISDSVEKILIRFNNVTRLFIGMDTLKLDYNIIPKLNIIFPYAEKYLIKLPNELDPDELVKYNITNKNNQLQIQLIKFNNIVDYKFNKSISKILN